MLLGRRQVCWKERECVCDSIESVDILLLAQLVFDSFDYS